MDIEPNVGHSVYNKLGFPKYRKTNIKRYYAFKSLNTTQIGIAI